MVKETNKPAYLAIIFGRKLACYLPDQAGDRKDISMKKGLQKILVGGIATMMVASLGLLAGCGGAQQGGSNAGAYKDGKYEAVGTGGRKAMCR